MKDLEVLVCKLGEAEEVKLSEIGKGELKGKMLIYINPEDPENIQRYLSENSRTSRAASNGARSSYGLGKLLDMDEAARRISGLKGRKITPQSLNNMRRQGYLQSVYGMQLANKPTDYNQLYIPQYSVDVFAKGFEWRENHSPARAEVSKQELALLEKNNGQFMTAAQLAQSIGMTEYQVKYNTTKLHIAAVSFNGEYRYPKQETAYQRRFAKDARKELARRTKG